MQTSTKPSKGPSRRVDWTIALVGAVVSALLGLATGYYLLKVQANQQEPGDQQRLGEMQKTNTELKAVNTHLDSVLSANKAYAKEIAGQSQALKLALTDLSGELKKNPPADTSTVANLFANLSSRVGVIADASKVLSNYNGDKTPIVTRRLSAIDGDQVIEIPRIGTPNSGERIGVTYDKYHSIGVDKELGEGVINVLLDSGSLNMKPGGQHSFTDYNLGYGPHIVINYKGLIDSKYTFEIVHHK